MRTVVSIVLALALPIISATTTQAVDVVTDPVGFYNVVYQTNSDTYFSMPFTRPDESRAVVASVSGSIITVNGSPWIAGQWVFPATSSVDGTVSNTYYVVITSGTKSGAYFIITNNTVNTLDVELTPEDLSGVTAGDTLRIHPFWTLGTIWPKGQGITPSPGTTGANRRTQVLFPNIGGYGYNLASAATYFFLQTATTTNWVLSTDTAHNYNHQIVLPDQYVIVRNQSLLIPTTTNTTVGQVSTYALRIPLYGTNVNQDCYIGLPRPSVHTLYDLGFTNNNNGNGFRPSAGTTGGARRDTLLVFNNTAQGVNKSTAATYYLLTNGQWRISTDSATDVGTNVVFTPGSGFIIRKYPTNTPVIIWNNVPNY